MRYPGTIGAALAFGLGAGAAMAQEGRSVQPLHVALAPMAAPGVPDGSGAPDAAARAMRAGARTATAKIGLIRSAPPGKPDPGRYHIVYDAAFPGTAPDGPAYRAGDLPASHPGYPVRRAEEMRGLAPGSCLSVQSGEVFCGPVAERLRAMAKGSDPARG